MKIYPKQSIVLDQDNELMVISLDADDFSLSKLALHRN